MQDSSNEDDKHAKLSEVATTNKFGAGYYEVFLPRTPEGLMCRLGLADYCGYTMQFLMYRSHSNGAKSFAETSNLFRNIGDIIIAVNGFDIRGWTFDETIRFIVDQSNFQHGVYIRALDISYGGLNKTDSTTASRVLNSPDSKDQHDHHMVGESLRTTSPAYAEDAFVLSQEDEIIFQNALEKEKDNEIVDDPTVKTPTITDVTSQLPLCPAPKNMLISPSSYDAAGSTNEYLVVVPKTANGFMFLLKASPTGYNGYFTTFNGYTRHDGRASDAENNRVFRNVGDIILAVDEVDMIGRSADEVFAYVSGKKRTKNVDRICLRLLDIKKADVKKAPKEQRDNKTKEQDSKKVEQPVCNATNNLVESILAPEPELHGLGWIRKSFNRKTDPKHIDRYWYTPITQKKLRSRPEVKRFLDILRNTGGDEELAFKIFKSKNASKEVLSKKHVPASIQDQLSTKLATQGACLNQTAIATQGVVVSGPVGNSKDEESLKKILPEEGLSFVSSKNCKTLMQVPNAPEDATETEKGRTFNDSMTVAQTNENEVLGKATKYIDGEESSKKIHPEEGNSVESPEYCKTSMQMPNIAEDATETEKAVALKDSMVVTKENRSEVLGEATIEGKSKDKESSQNSFLVEMNAGSSTQGEELIEEEIQTVTEIEREEFSFEILSAVQAKENDSLLQKPIRSPTEEEGFDKKSTSEQISLLLSPPSKQTTEKVQDKSTFEPENDTDDVETSYIDNEVIEVQHSQSHQEIKAANTQCREVTMKEGADARESDTSLHEIKDNHADSSFISMDLDDVSSLAPKTTSPIPFAVANPHSVCTRREIEELPIAFAFQTDIEESKHDAKAAQLLWHSDNLSASQKQRYIRHHVVGKAARLAPTSAKKKTVTTGSSFNPANTNLVETIIAPEPVLAGLGWIRNTYKRKKDPSHYDKYWFTPKTGKKLRSVPEVHRFLECLKKVNGDEEKAYMKLFGKK